jgi:dihydropyrimidine dehydrogenase (NAD+) subunit PreT
MNASLYEQELAQTNNIIIRHWMMPKELHTESGAVSAITLEKTEIGDDGKLRGTGETVTFRPIRCSRPSARPRMPARSRAWRSRSRKAASAPTKTRRTSHPKIWAGGDCVAGGEDLTVVSVEDGKIAAESIHKALMG